jgi:hypothetical protein
MLLAYLTLISGLFISAVAIWYSVSGLTSIFAAAVIPIVIMGTSLEIGKLVGTVWLKQNWKIAPRLLKAYLLIAVAILMLVTSMGIFGYLSKAHMDQTVLSGDSVDRVAILDEKIKTAKDNIDANRKALKQMDEAVDQSMARSSDEKGADKAVAIRRSQAKERTRLLADIEVEQKKIGSLSEERAPVAKELRKIEAEVGPIKYVAAMMYGDNPDQNILDKAVRWVIILLVIVFDPLAVILLLASQYSFDEAKRAKERTPLKDEDEEPSEETWFEKIKAKARVLDTDSVANSYVENTTPVDPGPPFEGVKDPSTGEWIQTGPSFPEEVKITHTKDSMLVEDSAGMVEIPFEPVVEAKSEEEIINEVSKLIAEETLQATEPTPEVIVLNKDYVSVNGQIYHHKAWDHQSENAQHAAEPVVEPKVEATYVQNEEQNDETIWGKIASKNITEEEYLRASQDKNRTS